MELKVNICVQLISEVFLRQRIYGVLHEPIHATGFIQYLLKISE